jgi:hypothetical protein
MNTHCLSSHILNLKKKEKKAEFLSVEFQLQGKKHWQHIALATFVLFADFQEMLCFRILILCINGEIKMLMFYIHEDINNLYLKF